jgi:hypothetical protein
LALWKARFSQQEKSTFKTKMVPENIDYPEVLLQQHQYLFNTPEALVPIVRVRSVSHL